MILIKNGYIKPIVGEDIPGGSLLLDNGKIVAIGKEIEAPAGAQIIDTEGALVTPGLVDGHSHTGLVLESIRFEGQSGNEVTDPLTPHMRGIDGFNPQSECIRQGLVSGVTTACVGPGSANVVGGTFSVVKLHGDCADDMLLKADVAMKCAFGENPKFAYGQKEKAPMTRMGQVALLRELLFKTVEYNDAKKLAETDPSKAPKYDQKLEAMLPVIRKEIPLKAHAHRQEDIFNAIRIAKEFDLLYTIEHCTEGWMVAEHMAKEGVRCFLGPLAPMSKSKYEVRNLSEQGPKILYEAGVKFGLIVDAPVLPQDHLMLQTALLVRQGLPEKAGWEAITINPAEIIGVADRVGSLEVGKDADVVIFSGDPMKEIDAYAKIVILNGEIVHQA